MKNYALALLCAAAAALAWAEDAPPACDAPCVHKVCVPELTTVVKDKVIYDDRCVDYCLPKCSLLSILKGGCSRGAGGCTNCGRPRTRHVLIKKFVHEECPDATCVVREQLP